MKLTLPQFVILWSSEQFFLKLGEDQEMRRESVTIRNAKDGEKYFDEKN
jgi:hypothetical protein